MLITSSDEGQSFSYGDEWDEGDLIYAGKGLIGNQQLKGVNRFVAENSGELFLFEYAGSEKLLFHDRITCVAHGESIDFDKEGDERRVHQFRLKLAGGKRAGQKTRSKGDRDADSSHRDASSFFTKPSIPAESHLSAGRAFPATQKAAAFSRNRPINAIKQPSATSDFGWIKQAGPSSKKSTGQSTCWRRDPAVYRMILGSPEDKLCLVTNRPVTTRGLQLLNSLGIGHAHVERGKVQVSVTAASQAIFG